MKRLALFAGALVLLVGAALLAVRAWRSANVGAVERGYRVAQAHGCFTCHGPGGLRAFDDPDSRVGGVPNFAAGDVRGYARNEQEIREWILDGVPKRLKDEPPEAGEPSLITMPAWRGVLSAREVDQLVAYITAASSFGTQPEEEAARGRDVATSLGCFACHGPEGRGNAPNPRSFKGYIPSWDGPDFPELVKDDGELREWIVDGSPRRLREHWIGGYFVRNQAIKMPAYGKRIKDEEIAAVSAYIKWLRTTPRR